MFNLRQNLDKQVRRQVEEFFGPELVLQTVIHKSVGIAEAAMLQKAAMEYSPATSGAFDFSKLTRELLEDTWPLQIREPRQSEERLSLRS